MYSTKFLKSLLLWSFIVLLPGMISPFSIANSFDGKVSLGALAATGDMDLSNAGSQYGVNTKMDMRYSSAVFVKATLHRASSNLGYDDASAVRELYLSWDWGKWSYSLGRQILPWGRADKFNPTDNLSPRIFRSIIVDDDEQRWGADIAKLDYVSGGPWSATLIWSPNLRGHDIPRTFVQMLTGDDTSPDADEDTWAIKTDLFMGSLEASFSYLRGVALLPYVKYSQEGNEVLRPEHEVIGADFFYSLNGNYGLRGEFAITDLAINAENEANAPEDFNYSVLGLERQLPQGWLVSMQYLRRDADEASGNLNSVTVIKNLNDAIWFQTENRDDSIAFGLSRAPFYSAFSGEFGVVGSLTQGAYSIFGELSLDLSENFNVSAFFTEYAGEDDTNYGALKRNRIVAIELKTTLGF